MQLFAKELVVEQDVPTAFQSADLHPNLELKDLGDQRVCLQQILKHLMERWSLCLELPEVQSKH